MVTPIDPFPFPLDGAALDALLADVQDDARPALRIVTGYPKGRAHHVGDRCSYCGHPRFKLCVCADFGHVHAPRKAARHAA